MDSRTADIKAIEQAPATVERTRHARDVKRSRAFPSRCLWSTAHGKIFIGFDATVEFTYAVLSKASWDSEVTYEAVHT
jgi:hypothetical protein